MNEITVSEEISSVVNGKTPFGDFFGHLLDKIVEFLPTLLFALVIYLVGCFLNKIVMKLITNGLDKGHLDDTVHGFIKSLVSIVLWIFVIIIVLTILGIPMNSIVAAVSSAGIAIGLSMKDSLSNVAGGILVLVGKQFKAGDYVSIDGTSGTVNEITILYTKMTSSDNKSIYIPNGIVSNAVIINYNAEKIRRVDWVFSISYQNDIKEAKNAIKEVIANNSLILQDKEQFIYVKALAASSVDIEVRVWTENANYTEVYYSMLEDIKEAFDMHGIVIPYNQLDIHMVEDK